VDLAQQLVELVGVTSVEELSGGYQSRVFVGAGSGGQRVVVKVLDTSVVDRRRVEARVATVAELALLDPSVCRPLPIEGRLVAELRGAGNTGGLVTCYEYASGAAFAAGDPDDANRMGRALAVLHESMRRVGPKDLPLVAPLRAVPFDDAGPTQLVHGDFNASNLRQCDGAVRVFDFDDCGYAPCLFDVANALYMVLFDTMTSTTLSYYRSFDEAFVSGYSATCGCVLDRQALDEFIDLRVAALGSWLDDPATAPIGIRTANPGWHATLRSFVDRYHARPR
jgi:Ser/Thr protein kinase RdoA (MazF antagonist)